MKEASVLQQEAELAKENSPPKRPFFIEHGIVALHRIDHTFLLRDEFHTRPGLFIWEGFEQRVLNRYLQGSSRGSTFILEIIDLQRKAGDEKIRKQLPRNFRLQLWYIAQLIKIQPKGLGEGPLSNYYPNIFYFNNLVIYVSWNGSAWTLNAFRYGHNMWYPGTRVFYPALPPRRRDPPDFEGPEEPPSLSRKLLLPA
jgi:hypothetical protein